MNSTAAFLAALPSFLEDLGFVGLAVAFFALAVAFARFCAKVR